MQDPRSLPDGKFTTTETTVTYEGNSGKLLNLLGENTDDPLTSIKVGLKSNLYCHM